MSRSNVIVMIFDILHMQQGRCVVWILHPITQQSDESYDQSSETQKIFKLQISSSSSRECNPPKALLTHQLVSSYSLPFTQEWCRTIKDWVSRLRGWLQMGPLGILLLLGFGVQEHQLGKWQFGYKHWWKPLRFYPVFWVLNFVTFFLASGTLDKFEFDSHR